MSSHTPFRHQVSLWTAAVWLLIVFIPSFAHAQIESMMPLAAGLDRTLVLVSHNLTEAIDESSWSKLEALYRQGQMAAAPGGGAAVARSVSQISRLQPRHTSQPRCSQLSARATS
jgi:hypothetical protein